MAGAYQTGIYRNVLKECGYEETAITERLEQTFETIFYGTEAERFYHEAGDDMAYLEDTGNHDVRTEGMSYGMMVCVQLNKKAEFDRLWKWVRTYMYIPEGPCRNYFAWSCSTDGTHNAEGPAPDGEEYFAMALFFASARWGDGEGIFAYSKEAKAILRECIHKGEPGHPGEPMWEPSNHLIKFVTNMDIICHIFMNCSQKMRRKETGNSGNRQRQPAENICIRHATRRPGFLQNMQTMTGHPMQDIRKSSEGMTGTTAMHTAP